MSEIAKIKQIHKASTRVVPNAGSVVSRGDFIFNSTGKEVPIGTPYHIHYLENPQQEIFMSGEKHSVASRLMTPSKGITLFKKYKDAKGLELPIVQYAGKTIPGPAEYSAGIIKRTFARKIVNGPNPLFEVKNSIDSVYYEYIVLSWRISGPMEEVREENEKTLEDISLNYPSIVKVIGNPLEYYVEQKTRIQRVSEALGVGELEEDVDGNIVITAEMLSSTTSEPNPPAGSFKMRRGSRSGIGKMKVKKRRTRQFAQPGGTGGGTTSGGSSGGSSGGGSGGGGAGY